MNCPACQNPLKQNENGFYIGCNCCVNISKDTFTSYHSRQLVDYKTEGTKHDSQKIRLELLPTEALEEVAKVLTFGAKKYGDWNWRNGMAYSRLYGAALRHLFAWNQGTKTDAETSLHHVAHAACCLLFLLTYELKGLGTDDRRKL